MCLHPSARSDLIRLETGGSSPTRRSLFDLSGLRRLPRGWNRSAAEVVGFRMHSQKEATHSGSSSCWLGVSSFSQKEPKLFVRGSFRMQEALGDLHGFGLVQEFGFHISLHIPS